MGRSHDNLRRESFGGPERILAHVPAPTNLAIGDSQESFVAAGVPNDPQEIAADSDRASDLNVVVQIDPTRKSVGGGGRFGFGVRRGVVGAGVLLVADP